jgi:hypothetical protein
MDGMVNAIKRIAAYAMKTSSADQKALMLPAFDDVRT